MASLFDLAIAQENMLRGKYINAQTGTTYTLALVDAGAIVTLTNAGAIALTVPANADVAFATNSAIILIAGGAGTVTVAGDTGVTVNAANSDATLAQNDWGILVKTGTNTWQFTVFGGAGGGGSGYDEGTSFPVSPADNDKFYRTDLNLLCFYNGTRWLTVDKYILELRPFAVATNHNISATTQNLLSCYPFLAPDYDFWVEEFRATNNVQGTSNGTNFWTIALIGAASIASYDTKLDAGSTNVRHTVTVGALMGTTSTYLRIDVTKTSAPGNLALPATCVIGRLVIT
jgi:hypothetical protein